MKICAWACLALVIMMAAGDDTILLVSFREEERAGFRLRLRPGESVREALGRRSGLHPPSLDLEVYSSSRGAFELLDEDAFSRVLPRHASILVSVKVKDSAASRSASASLAIEGRLFGSGSSGMVIDEQGEGTAHVGTGLVSWDAAVVLSSYLESHAAEFCLGKSIIELGAGTGTAGIKAASLGASLVVLTDLEYSLANLARNVEANREALSTCNVEVRELDWFKSETWQRDNEVSWDIILLADVVWLEELVQPLVNVLIALAKPTTVILLSHQLRTTRTDDLLFSSLIEGGFLVSKVPKAELRSDARSDKISIYRLNRPL